MADQLTIVYTYRFRNGAVRTFNLLLDKETLALAPGIRGTPPAWARLDYHQCSHCPLSITQHPFCPIAENLSGIAESFLDRSSLDEVHVDVDVEERRYAKDTTVQHGLSPLWGIIMTTSGCPAMEPLKPMVRYHLPFASLEETTFRMVSMYLVGQLLRQQEGKTMHPGLEGIAGIYAEVEKVNKGFAKRVHAAAQNDANVNALVNLDMFAIMVPRVAEDMLQQIKPYFSAHLK